MVFIQFNELQNHTQKLDDDDDDDDSIILKNVNVDNYVESRILAHLAKGKTKKLQLMQCQGSVESIIRAGLQSGVLTNLAVRHPMEDRLIGGVLNSIGSGLSSNESPIEELGFAFVAPDINSTGVSNQGFNEIEDDWMTFINGIRDCHTLRHVQLGHHTAPRLKEEFAHSFSSALWTRPLHLKSLALISVDVSDEMLGDLAEACVANPNLHNLTLISCDVSDAAVEAFSKRLPEMKGLEELTIKRQPWTVLPEPTWTRSIS